MKLLIVNDEKLTANMMKKEIIWKDYGIDEVFTAYDVKEAKEVIGEQQIDVLLCDIEMPGENGIALLRWIREEQKDIECIFLTCHASFEYAREAVTLGCQDYILIPAKYEDIGKAVEKVVKRIRIREEEKRYQELGRRTVQENLATAAETHGVKKSAQQVAEEVVKYIKEHLTEEELCINEIASWTHMHPVYLNRIFKKEKESSIGQYIISERMKLAEALLLENKLNAYAVAEQVGYKSYSNFNLTFKKTFGESPTQYINRKSHKE
ncbi:hypothetical protein B5F07_07925 [Lachnoclostridium sp. An169]|uniref:response regulator transcription factor n=1 Tax=Lachnoclostridium sp. An169 TaxID=1965569 RepID=UPI000B3ADE50|nr:response regulator [Lachnoclostridium sp. An169]OUP84381.1 hypothetical protein B5F07_07925 [Lachnoclostridium sp. An169]